MKRDYRELIMTSFNLLIIIVNAMIYWCIWTYFYKLSIINPFYEKGTILLIFLYIIISGSLTSLYGGYKVGFYRISELIYSHIVALIFANVITYIQVSLIARAMVNIGPILLMTAIQVIFVVGWSYFANKRYFSMNPPLKTMLIYARSDIDIVLQELKNRKDRYFISEIYPSDYEKEDVFRVIKEKNIEAIFICDLESKNREDLIKYCFYNSIKIFVLPSFTDILLKSAELYHDLDIPLFAFRNSKISLNNSLFKRILDLIISLGLILLSLPIILIIALAIKLDDGGSIFYKQNRLTKDNKIFEIIKFRSMVEGAELDGTPVLSYKDDPRLTRVGKIIRKIRFDEIPQFINIIKGDMSLVGPRPERPELAQEYIKLIPEFAYRTNVKAGLTGYGQLMGKYDSSPEDKLKLDLYYIANYSIQKDLILIIMTLRKLISRD